MLPSSNVHGWLSATTAANLLFAQISVAVEAAEAAGASIVSVECFSASALMLLAK